MKAAPLRLPTYLGNVGIYIKNLSASFPQLVKKERDPLTPAFFGFPPASPFYLALSITRLGYFESEPHFWVVVTICMYT